MGLDWQSILSGERRGPGAAVLRGGLSLLRPFYAGAVRLRNHSYDAGWRTATRVEVPVVSIGNLTTGGTGKTPMVAWVVNALVQRGLLPGILSRGYRAIQGAENDEKLLLDSLCPDVPHVQNPDRVSGARLAIDRHRCEVLVLDDGFQHRQIVRDLDVVLIDGLCPWGYGSLLPRGLLREPLQSLRRADVVCLTRVDQISESRRKELHAEIAQWTAAPVVDVAFVPTGLLNSVGQQAPLEILRSSVVGACCGIGNPEGFRRTLTALGAPLTADRFREYPDHYHYPEYSRPELAEWVRAAGIELVVVTRKDLVKLSVTRIGRAPVWALEIEARLLQGEHELTSRLKAVAESDPDSPSSDDSSIPLTMR